MYPYEKLKLETPVTVDDNAKLPASVKGLYVETPKSKAILINKSVKSYAEKNCILAEELGHYHTSIGDIIDQTKLRNRKQESRARKWGYEKLVPLDGILLAYKAGVRNRFELAEFLDVIENFLDSAIRHYQEKYGLYAVSGRYCIYFEPLAVLEMFESDFEEG